MNEDERKESNTRCAADLRKYADAVEAGEIGALGIFYVTRNADDMPKTIHKKLMCVAPAHIGACFAAIDLLKADATETVLGPPMVPLRLSQEALEKMLGTPGQIKEAADAH